MNSLTLVFALKISVSLVVLVLPMMFLPKTKLARLMATDIQDVSIYRLYSMAILALLVAYSFGLWASLDGQLHYASVTMGIVSNLGASVVMLITGMWLKQRVLWAFFSLIGALLLLTLVSPQLMIAPLF